MLLNLYWDELMQLQTVCRILEHRLKQKQPEPWLESSMRFLLTVAKSTDYRLSVPCRQQNKDIMPIKEDMDGI